MINPLDLRQLHTDCAKHGWPLIWPNSKSDPSTAEDSPQRQPIPIDFFLKHQVAKLANLNKAEVFSIILLSPM